jgi:hypothetical protein
MIRLALAALALGAVLEAAPGQKAMAPSDASLPKVLWRAPNTPTLQDWTCGRAGCNKSPQPPFRFVSEEPSGTNPKILVRDSDGHAWSVKFGAEVIPECFASRFVTAMGYFAEPTYCIRSGKIDGIGKLGRARRVVKKDGSFRNARFEIRNDRDLIFLKEQTWSWEDNPFRNTHELAGLKILVMLLSNWDTKDARDGDESNNGVFRDQSHDRPELSYGVFDWGASLGRWGHLLHRDQSDCAGYAGDTPRFVTRARTGEIEWGYSGKHDLKSGITVEDVRWLLPYLSRATPDRIGAALQASGATERQARCWTWSVENRIEQLRAITK